MWASKNLFFGNRTRSAPTETGISTDFIGPYEVLAQIIGILFEMSKAKRGPVGWGLPYHQHLFQRG